MAILAANSIVALHAVGGEIGPVVELVLFDIDGTLIQTGGAGMKAFEAVLASEFNAPEAARELVFHGRTDPSIVRDFFISKQMEPSLENFERFFSRYVFWLDHLIKTLPGQALPGVEKMIRDLQAMPDPPLLGLLTGNIRLGAEIKLRQYDLWAHFETGAFGDDHEDRNQLAVIARERGSRFLGRELEGDEIVVIGDTPRDIECAEAIGAKSLAVATGAVSLHQLKAHKPTWAVESLCSVPVEALCGRTLEPFTNRTRSAENGPLNSRRNDCRPWDCRCRLALHPPFRRRPPRTRKASC